MRRVAVPRSAVKVTSYEKLERLVRAFADVKLGLLIVVGNPGIQKSRLLKKYVCGNGCFIEGHATAFQIYIELFLNRDKLTVLDDIDNLVGGDKSAVRLLKCLTNTSESKDVSWNTDSATLKQLDIPTKFTTKSKVAIVCNTWSTLNNNILAIEDRGHVIHFAPTPLAIHARTAEWFTDAEVFHFIGQRLHRLGDALSMRLYYRSLELKSAGLEWKEFIEERCDRQEEFSFATDVEAAAAIKLKHPETVIT